MYIEDDRSLSIPQFVKKNALSVLLGGFYYDKNKPRVITVVHIYLLVLFFALPITFTFLYDNSTYVYVFLPLGIFFFTLTVKSLIYVFHVFFDKNERGVPREVFKCFMKKKNRKENESNLVSTGNKNDVFNSKNIESSPSEEIENVDGQEGEGEEIVIDLDYQNSGRGLDRLLSEENEEVEEGGEKLSTDDEDKPDDDEVTKKVGEEIEKVDEPLDEIDEEKVEIEDHEEHDNDDNNVPEQREGEEISHTEDNNDENVNPTEEEPVNLPMETFYFQDENGIIYEYKMLMRDARYEGDYESLGQTQMMTTPTPVAINNGDGMYRSLTTNDVPNMMNRFVEGYYPDDQRSVGEVVEREEPIVIGEEGEGANDGSENENQSGESSNLSILSDELDESLLDRKHDWIEGEATDLSNLFQYSIFGYVIPIYFDRSFLEQLFDRNMTILEILLSLLLATLVGGLEVHVLYRQEYFLSKLVVAAVATTCFFSLFKSPQPDSNAFLHYSTLFSFTRPFYFCVVAIIYTIFIEVDTHVLTYYSCFKEIPCYVIIFFPLIFLFGYLPNYQTFIFHVIEFLHITVFGGTGIVDFYGIFFFAVVDVFVVGFLFSLHYFIPHEKEGFEGIHYLRDFIYVAFLNGFAYFCSRLTNDYVGIRRILNLYKLGRILLDIVFSLFVAFLGTSFMTIPSPPLYYVGSVTFIVGVIRHSLIKQLKVFHPFYVLKRPCFCMNFPQFRAFLVIFNHLLSCLETGLYMFLITSALNTNVTIATSVDKWYNSLIFAFASYKITVMIHTPNIKRAYKILFFSILYYYFEGRRETSFIFIMFVFSIAIERIEDLFSKIRFILVYRNPRSFSRMYHLLFYPFWFPHTSFFLISLLWSAATSSPIIPWLGSNLWMLSYPRPVKFWERKYKTKRKDLNTMSFSQSLTSGFGSSTFANNLNSIFYEHLCIVLKRNCRSIVEVMGEQLETGDFFILMNRDPSSPTPDLTALIHFVEVGGHFLTFQLRGLEFDGTICQSKEQDALLRSVDLEKDDGLCGLNCFLKFKDIRKTFNYTWKVISNQLELETYKRVEVRAKGMLISSEGRKLVLKYYPYAIIYYVLCKKNMKKLDQWIKKKVSSSSSATPSSSRVNPIFQAAIEGVREETVDRDTCFHRINDEFGIVDPDFDAFRNGISYQLFVEHFGGFIEICIKNWRKRCKRKLRKKKLLRKFKRKRKKIGNSGTRRSSSKRRKYYDSDESVTDFEDPFDELDSDDEDDEEDEEKKKGNNNNNNNQFPFQIDVSVTHESMYDNMGKDVEMMETSETEEEDYEHFEEKERSIYRLLYKLTVCARKSLYSEPGFLYGLRENPRQFVETLFRNITMDFNVLDDLWVFEDDQFLRIFSKSLLLSLRLFKDSFVRPSYLSKGRCSMEDFGEEEEEEKKKEDKLKMETTREEEEVIKLNMDGKNKKRRNDQEREKEDNNDDGDNEVVKNLYDVIHEYNNKITMCTENDPEWRSAIVKSEKDQLFTLRKIVNTSSDPVDIGKYNLLELKKEKQNFSVIKVNKDSVRSLWASQSNELIFMENQNRERGSIQQFKYGLRNIVSSSADVPVGYPAFISPHVTGYFISVWSCFSSIFKLGIVSKVDLRNFDWASISSSVSINNTRTSNTELMSDYDNLEDHQQWEEDGNKEQEGNDEAQ